MARQVCPTFRVYTLLLPNGPSANFITKSMSLDIYSGACACVIAWRESFSNVRERFKHSQKFRQHDRCDSATKSWRLVFSIAEIYLYVFPTSFFEQSRRTSKKPREYCVESSLMSCFRLPASSYALSP